MINTRKKIIVGLSGGVDSAVAAWLLKEQGYPLIGGIFMQNWEAQANDPYCTAEKDMRDAKAVCDRLDIPFHVVNFEQEYWDRVFQYCLDELALGRTPNPDVWCNREIKFNVFLKYALELGADYIATGHYARIERRGNQYQLYKGKDLKKDQSYFLYALNQFALKHACFPLGDLNKLAVRALAKQAGLKNAEKKDSTGICFIGERKFKSFLQGFMLSQPGNIETIEGEIIAKHDGLMFYTLGQRQGLNIGGRRGTENAPWYVLKKDVKRNVLIVGQGEKHPVLYAKALTFHQASWMSGKAPKLPLNCHAKIRYRQNDQACVLSMDANNKDFLITFEKAQRAITPGQSVVLYLDDRCLGGGIILKPV
jgi:tRNA-specific 2-thiouridylase